MPRWDGWCPDRHFPCRSHLFCWSHTHERPFGSRKCICFLPAALWVTSSAPAHCHRREQCSAASIPPASLGLLGTGQAHLSVPHCPASELLAVLAHDKVPERRNAEHLMHPKDSLTLHVSPQSQGCTQGCKSSIQGWEGDCTSKAEEGLVTGGQHSPDQRHKLES